MNLSARMQRLPIYTAALATIVVTPSLMDPINLPKLWILCLGAGVSFAIFFSQILSLWTTSKRTILVVSGLFGAALLITSVASPQGSFRTMVGVWGRNNGSLTYLALLVIFSSLASINSNESSKYFIRALTVLGILGSLYGLLQHNGTDLFTWDNPGNKIILTLGNSDFASALLALTAIATLTFLLKEKMRNWKKVFLVISILIQMYLTYMSGALQGFLVLLVGSAILIGCYLTFSNRSSSKRLAIAWWGILLVGGVFGVLGLAGSGPLSNFLNPNLRSIQDRYYHWVAALNMMKNHLIFGVGIDSFGDFYRNSRVLEAIKLRGSAAPGTNNAHNTLMQIGATGGLVLLLAYLTLLIFTGYRAVIAIKINNDKILVSGVFSIWIAFQVQSLVSIDQIGLVVWGWAAAGCLVALSYVDIEEKKSKKVLQEKTAVKSPRFFKSTVPTIGLIAFGLLPSIFIVPALQNELAIRSKIINLLSSTSDQALRPNSRNLFLEAKKSQQPELRLLVSQYLGQSKSSDLALELVLTTVKQFPESFESWDALAQIYEGRGQKEKAVIAREMTVKLDPLNEEIKKLLESDKASD